jgi:hypothetical protein
MSRGGGGPDWNRNGDGTYPFSSSGQANERGGRIRGQGSHHYSNTSSSSSYYYQDSEMSPFHDYLPPSQGIVGWHGGVSSSEIYHRERQPPLTFDPRNDLREERGMNGRNRFGFDTSPDYNQYHPPPSYPNMLNGGRKSYRPHPREFDAGYSDQDRGFHPHDLLRRDYGREDRDQHFYEGRRLNQSRVSQPSPGYRFDRRDGRNSHEDRNHIMSSSSTRSSAHPSIGQSFSSNKNRSITPAQGQGSSGQNRSFHEEQYGICPRGSHQPPDLRRNFHFHGDDGRNVSQPLPLRGSGGDGHFHEGGSRQEVDGRSLPPDWIGKALFVATTVLCVVYYTLSHYYFNLAYSTRRS